jgi:hypothetical protein
VSWKQDIHVVELQHTEPADDALDLAEPTPALRTRAIETLRRQRDAARFGE